MSSDLENLELDEQGPRLRAPISALGRHARQWQPHPPLQYYLLSIGMIALVTLLGAAVVPGIAPTNLVMFYLVAVVVAAVYLGRGPSILAAILGVLAMDFFIIPPHFTFAVADTQYLLTFIGLLIVGLVISTLTAQVREQANTARRHEMQTNELYQFTRALAVATGLDEIAQSTITHVEQTFGRAAVVWLAHENRMDIQASSPGASVTPDEIAVARMALEHGEPAGRGTVLQPGVGIWCVPLKTAHNILGVLGILSAESPFLFSPEQRRLLESFVSQAALAIERSRLAEQAKQAQLLQAAEKLQATLLNSISHDLRTPLVSITGTLSALQEDGNEPIRQSMIDTAYAEARRLNRLVGNLLDITRIESGAMRVREVPCDVQDVIGSALQPLGDRLKGRTLTVDLDPDLPLVPMDFVLIVQVLVNLIENAAKYSAADAPIEIEACVSGKELEVRIADRGIGIPAVDLQRIFDKFYRVRRPDGVIGTGLGLSICKGIVEAHHGRIQAANREGGGTVLLVRLPLDRG